MTDWVPVAQILGNIPIPVAAPTAVDPALNEQYVPLPPNLPWPVLLVSLIWVFQFSHGALRALYMVFAFPVSVFVIAWLFVLANWARKLSGKNTALVLAGIYVTGSVVSFFMVVAGFVGHMPALSLFGSFFVWVCLLCKIVAAFTIRDAMEEYYTTTENIGLGLGPIFTLVFNVMYIQFHVNRIARWKRTGELN